MEYNWCLHDDCLTSTNYFNTKSALDIHMNIHKETNSNNLSILNKIDNSDKLSYIPRVSNIGNKSLSTTSYRDILIKNL